jgi:hypothetical protein
MTGKQSVNAIRQDIKSIAPYFLKPHKSFVFTWGRMCHIVLLHLGFLVIRQQESYCKLCFSYMDSNVIKHKK